MKRFAIALALVAVALPSVASSKRKEPDFSFVLRATGRFSIAHACPIASDLVLTSAHVVDPDPLSRNSPLIGYRFQSVAGETYGFLSPLITVGELDIAVVEPSVPVVFYPRATRAPEKDETLYFLVYDYRKPDVAFSPHVSSGTVVNVVAGMVVVKGEVLPGSSGGCVLNESGEVVALVTARMGMDNGDNVGILDGVWGNWIDPLLKKVEEMRAAEKITAEDVK